MNDMIDLMKAHTSVRNFTEEKIPAETLRELINVGRAASNWKNFQSYSIIVVDDQEQKDKIFEIQAQKSIKNCSAFLVFVGDLNREEKAVKMNDGDFKPAGIESLLISSVDAAVAESLGFGGVMVGLIRDQYSRTFCCIDFTRFYLSHFWNCPWKTCASQPSQTMTAL